MKTPATFISLKSLTALSALGIVLAAGSGCTSAVSNNETHQPILRMDPVYFRPNLAVSERKITGESTVSRFFFFEFVEPFRNSTTSSSSACEYIEPELFKGLNNKEAEALRAAIFRACESNDAEYLIAPHYLITTTKFPLLSFIWTSYTCRVSGFAAKVTSVTPIDKTDEAHVELTVSTKKGAGETTSATISEK